MTQVNTKISGQKLPTKPQLQKPPVKVNSSSWFSTLGKASLSATALAFISYVVYQRHFSPSRVDHLPQTSAIGAYVEQFAPDCNSSAFKALQTALNTFETSHHFASLLGVQSKKPPGDIQAFLLDQNFKALDCALSTYPEEYFSFEMKNKLLGRVLEHIEVNQRDLVDAEKWLIENGASVHHQTLVSQNDGIRTPLLTAYRTLNPSLYQWLLNQGARVDLNILSYNDKTGAYDQPQHFMGYLLDDMKASAQKTDPDIIDRVKKMDDAYQCSAYKKIVDASLAQISRNMNLGDVETSKLRVRTYMYLNDALCANAFKCSREEQQDYYSDELAAKLNQFSETMKAFFKWFEKQEPQAQEFNFEEEESLWQEVQNNLNQRASAGAEYVRTNPFTQAANETIVKGVELVEQTTGKALELAQNGLSLAQSGLSRAGNGAYDILKTGLVEGASGAGSLIVSSAKKSGQLFSVALEHVILPSASIGFSALKTTAHGTMLGVQATHNYLLKPAAEVLVSSSSIAAEGAVIGLDFTKEYAIKPALNGAQAVIKPVAGIGLATGSVAMDGLKIAAGKAVVGLQKVNEFAITPSLNMAGQATSAFASAALAGAQLGVDYSAKPVYSVLSSAASAGYTTAAAVLGVSNDYVLQPTLAGVSVVGQAAKLGAQGVKELVIEPTFAVAGDVKEAALDAINDRRSQQRFSNSLAAKRI